jgi:HlyD family secretion protein
MAKHISRCLIVLPLAILTLACSRHPTRQAQGYIEGRYTYMATSVSGALKELLVHKGSKVKSGDILFMLEEKPESDAYNQAVQTLAQAVAARDAVAANLIYAKLRFERDKVLVPKRAVQQSELDSAKASYDATIADLAGANANIDAMTAALAQSKWSKDKKIVYAPVNAMVFDTYYRLGERTIANQPVMSLLAPQDIKAIFYIPEADLATIKINDTVANLICKVESVSFLLRRNIRRPSFTVLKQRQN